MQRYSIRVSMAQLKVSQPQLMSHNNSFYNANTSKGSASATSVLPRKPNKNLNSATTTSCTTSSKSNNNNTTSCNDNMNTTITSSSDNNNVNKIKTTLTRPLPKIPSFSTSLLNSFSNNNSSKSTTTSRQQRHDDNDKVSNSNSDNNNVDNKMMTSSSSDNINDDLQSTYVAIATYNSSSTSESITNTGAELAVTVYEEMSATTTQSTALIDRHNNTNSNNHSSSVATTMVNYDDLPANLVSLAQASPQTIEYLKQFGNRAVLAEKQYNKIKSEPTLHEYYLLFLQSVSSAVLASQSIASDMLEDCRLSTAEQVVGGMQVAANLLGGPFGSPIIIGIGQYLVQLPHKLERQRSIRRITTCFPSVDAHKFIEMVARELTIYLEKEIKAVLRQAKSQTKKSILARVMKAVEWLQTADNLSPVQGYACGHAARLIDTVMKLERPFEVQYEHVPLLMHWACGLTIDPANTVNYGITAIATPISSNISSLVTSGSNTDNEQTCLLGIEYSNNNDTECNSNDYYATTTLPSPHVTPLSSPTAGAATAAATIYAQQSTVDEQLSRLEKRLSLEQKERIALQMKVKDIDSLRSQLKNLTDQKQSMLRQQQQQQRHKMVTTTTTSLLSANDGRERGELLGYEETCEYNNNSFTSSDVVIDNHANRQAIQQEEVLRELILQIELLLEDNNNILSQKLNGKNSSDENKTTNYLQRNIVSNGAVTKTSDNNSESMLFQNKECNHDVIEEDPINRYEPGHNDTVGTGGCCTIS